MKSLFLLNTHSIITMPSSPEGACLWELCNGYEPHTHSQDTPRSPRHLPRYQCLHQAR